MMARARADPAVSLKVVRATALLMAVVARVKLKAIARTAGVMVQAAVIETVEVVRNMAGAVVMDLTRVMVRTGKVMAGATAEARVIKVMTVENGKVVVRDRVMAQVAVMVMARVTDAVARTMARVARVMAVDAARVKGTARDNPISTITATAVVKI